MKNTILLFSILIALVACSDQNDDSSLVVRGSIDGLKVGKVLLQQLQDSALVTLDSMQLEGNGNYELGADIAEPQILYLYLDVKDGVAYDDRIAFFAEDTTMTINSTLNNFEKDAVITGSKNQKILEEFNQNKDRLNEVYTDLMKRSMTLQQEDNPSQEKIEQLNTEYEKYLRKRILYAVNFADLHKDKAVAPYLLLQEGFDANPVLLDSVYQKMPKKIQTTIYGKQLSELIENRKASL